MLRFIGLARGVALAIGLAGCIPDAELSDERSPPPTSTTGSANTSALVPGTPPAVAAKDDGLPPQIQSLRLEPGECVHVLALPNKPASIGFSFHVGDREVKVPGRPRSDGWVEAFAALPSLMPEATGQVSASAVDGQGRASTSEPQAFTTPRPRPTLVITEVLANPAGSEYTQEFVELYNYGDASLSLLGLSLADSAGADALGDVTLPPKSFALVVASAFDDSGALDPRAAPGSLLVRVEGRIGRDGISNGGEPITLRNAQGAVVSQYAGFIDMSATTWNGRSAHRVPIDDPCDQRYLWTERPQPPSPGW